jgi:uncharacterized protein YciI
MTKKTYALIYTMLDIEKSNAARPAHIEFLRSLLRDGRIVTGWKFPEYEPGALQGMLICSADSKEQVAGWFREDPVILCGSRTFQVREALPMQVQA